MVIASPLANEPHDSDEDKEQNDATEQWYEQRANVETCRNCCWCDGRWLGRIRCARWLRGWCRANGLRWLTKPRYWCRLGRWWYDLRGLRLPCCNQCPLTHHPREHIVEGDAKCRGLSAIRGFRGLRRQQNHVNPPVVFGEGQQFNAGSRYQHSDGLNVTLKEGRLRCGF